MPTLCEKELSEILQVINNQLQAYGFKAEQALVRDYMLKAFIYEGENKLGKLIIDYSPKKKSHNFRKDSDMTDLHFDRVMDILNDQVRIMPEVTVSAVETQYVAYVDGSFIDGSIGYGAVILKDQQIIDELYGRVDDPDAFASRQVGGEIRAVLETLQWCKSHQISEITIYFDFLNIEKWATGAYKTNTPMTTAYKQAIDSCGIKIYWHWVESHTGNVLNDRADALAKQGARGRSDSVPPYGWLVYNGNINSLKFTEQVDWLLRAAKANGIKLDAVKNDEILAGVNAGKAILYGSKAGELPQFALFWDKDVRLARQLEKMGIRLFNSAETLFICDDKTLTHQVLSDAGIPMPKTIYAPLVFPGSPYENDAFIELIESQLEYPMVVKEAFGSFGAQVYMAKDRAELLELRKKLVYVPHLYQEYVKSSSGRDVRLQVVGGKVVASVIRTNASDFRANVTAGGSMHVFDSPAAFRDMAVKAAKLTGADFAGVDILFDANDGPILCEVNSNAHIKNLYNCTGVDVADLMLKYIKESL